MKKIKRNEWGLSDESIKDQVLVSKVTGWDRKDQILNIIVPQKLSDYVLGKRPVEPKLEPGFFWHSEKIQEYVEAKIRYHFAVERRKSREEKFEEYIMSLYHKKQEVYVRFV